MSQAKCGFDDRGSVSARNLLVRLCPTLRVEIGFDADYDADQPRRLARLAMPNVSALIDTGASISCIDSGVAMELQLPIINRTSVAGVGGLHQFNVHLAQIRAPELNFTFYGPFTGVDLAASGQQRIALIGRDFLAHFHMTYDGPSGSVTLTDPHAPVETGNWPDE